MLPIYLITKDGMYLKDQAGKVIEYFCKVSAEQTIKEMCEAGEEGWELEEMLLPIS